jgi:hypothetical protein
MPVPQRWLKMSWVSAYSALHTVCPGPWNKLPFSAFTMPLYLSFRGGWPNLAHGISGVWALGQKLRFQLLLPKQKDKEWSLSHQSDFCGFMQPSPRGTCTPTLKAISGCAHWESKVPDGQILPLFSYFCPTFSPWNVKTESQLWAGRYLSQGKWGEVVKYYWAFWDTERDYAPW